MTTTRRRQNREIRHLVAGESCKQSIGNIYYGMEVFGLTNGQFSFIDVIENLIDQTGPADLDISTWVAADYDLKHLDRFLKNDQIKRLRFFVDRSFPNRQPEFFQTLLDLFGGDCVRIARVHSKFAIITNDDWKLAIRTSMNLNENRRIENFEISDSPELSSYLIAILDSFFADPFEYKISRPATKQALQKVAASDYLRPDEDISAIVDDMIGGLDISF